MRLAFSVPVHEKNEVVANLIGNLFRYNPGCQVVLHVSQLFADFDREQFSKMPNVVINPRQHLTKHGKGMLLSHCTNFQHLRASADFDVFCIISSNEMFIRKGLVDYIKEAGNGFQAVPFDLREDWHVFDRLANRHPKMLALLEALKTSVIYGGQTEGQFFRKDVFGHICDLYLSTFGEDDINDFETEEVVPQTVAMSMGIKPAKPFTLVDYSHPIDYRLTPRVIDMLVNPRLLGKVKLNLGQKLRGSLVSPHLNGDDRSVFSVKRVPREINDSLRVFINSLPAAGEAGGSHGLENQKGRMVPVVPNLRRKQFIRSLKAKLRRVLGWFRSKFR